MRPFALIDSGNSTIPAAQLSFLAHFATLMPVNLRITKPELPLYQQKETLS